MKMLLMILLSSCLCSCYAYKVYPKEFRKHEAVHERPLVYVENPELKEELEIIRASGLFQFTEDSTAAQVRRIRLHKITRRFVCGQPLVITAFTLGQLPVYLQDVYYFQFDETDAGKLREHRLPLKVARRVWFWDLFSFQKNFSKAAGLALAGEYRLSQ